MKKIVKTVATFAFAGVLAMGAVIAPLSAHAATSLKSTTETKSYKLKDGKKV